MAFATVLGAACASSASAPASSPSSAPAGAPASTAAPPTGGSAALAPAPATLALGQVVPSANEVALGIAGERGYYREAGITLDVSQFQTSTDVVRALSGGSLQIGSTSP